MNKTIDEINSHNIISDVDKGVMKKKLYNELVDKLRNKNELNKKNVI